MHLRGPGAGSLEHDRDLAQLQEGRVFDVACGRPHDGGGDGRLAGERRPRIVQGPAAAVKAAQVLGRVQLADRKSTRLNSSHVRISYAVFCLKKKKTMADTTHVYVLA